MSAAALRATPTSPAGAATPRPRVLTNADLERMVDTSDEWIVSRTGIRERRVAAAHETTASMARGRRRCGRSPSPASSPTRSTSSCSPRSRRTTGCPRPPRSSRRRSATRRAAAMDVAAACSGLRLRATPTAQAYVTSGHGPPRPRHRRRAADPLPRLHRPEHLHPLRRRRRGGRRCRRPTSPAAPLGIELTTEPQGAYMIWLPAGGAKSPPSAETIARGEHFIRMEGKETYRFATKTLAIDGAGGDRAGRPPAPTTSTCSSRTRPTSGSSRPWRRASACRWTGCSSTSTATATRRRRRCRSPSPRRSTGPGQGRRPDRHRRLRGRLHLRRGDDRVDGRPGPRRPRRGDPARGHPRPAAGRLGLGRPDPAGARRDPRPARAGRRPSRRRPRRRRPRRSRPLRRPTQRRSTHDRSDRQDRHRHRRLARHRPGDRRSGWRPQGADVAFSYRGNAGGRRRRPRRRRGARPAGAARSRRDVTDPASAEAVVKATLEAFGKVDILVNNAGITRDDLIMRMSLEAWRDVLETNLFGAFYMTKAVTRPMLKAARRPDHQHHRVSGQAGQTGQANYSSAKAGLIGLTKATARELASRGITVQRRRARLRPDRADRRTCPRRSRTRSTAGTPLGPLRDDRGDRRRGRLPRLRRGRLHHRPGPGRRRRPRDDVAGRFVRPRPAPATPRWALAGPARFTRRSKTSRASPVAPGPFNPCIRSAALCAQRFDSCTARTDRARRAGRTVTAGRFGSLGERRAGSRGPTVPHRADPSWPGGPWRLGTRPTSPACLRPAHPARPVDPSCGRRLHSAAASEASALDAADPR